MKGEKGKATRRARYISVMCELLAQRVERYEGKVYEKFEEHGVGYAYCGYDVGQAESGENISRMIVQLRMELLELRKML